MSYIPECSDCFLGVPVGGVAMLNSLTALAIVVGSALLSPAYAVPYNAINIGHLGLNEVGYGFTDGVAINNSGIIVGHSLLFDGGLLKGERAISYSKSGGLQNLGTLSAAGDGYGGSRATGVNHIGQVIGTFTSYTNTGANNGDRAFRYSDIEGMKSLGTLGTDSKGFGHSSASSINNIGQVVGGSVYFEGGINKDSRAFRYTDGVGIENLGQLGTDTLGNGFSAALSINHLGNVTGLSKLYINNIYKGYRAFRYSDDTGMVDLGVLGTNNAGIGESAGIDINDLGQVAGSSDTYSNGIYKGRHAFRFTDGIGMEDLGTLSHDAFGRGFSSAHDINNNGEVTGYFVYFENGVRKGDRAFRFTDQNGMEDLGILGVNLDNEGSSVAHAINELGQIVGHSDYYLDNIWQGQRATFADVNVQFVDLNLLVSLDPGWVLTNAKGINNEGEILAVGYNSITNNYGAFLLTPVPEPATYLLLMTGLVLMGIVVHRRRQGKHETW